MKRFTLCLFVLLACAVVVAVSSAPAYAVDGVVLINQNTATSGLPGCPTGGTFPIIICNSGSYRLSGNLVVTGNADGIDIRTDNVTLDLNGFTISGPITCSGVVPPTCTGIAGIGISSFNFVTRTVANNSVVRNGVVRGFREGVDLGGNNNTVEEITAAGNLEVGISAGSALVRRNTASLNGTFGLNVSDSSVTENVANGNGIYGIAATDSTVTENTANRNGQFGLSIERGIYGSNTFSNNSTAPVQSFGGVSQGNNYCGTATPC